METLDRKSDEDSTTIKISKDVHKRLERHAAYRDTMNAVVSRLLDKLEEVKE